MSKLEVQFPQAQDNVNGISHRPEATPRATGRAFLILCAGRSLMPGARCKAHPEKKRCAVISNWPRACGELQTIAARRRHVRGNLPAEPNGVHRFVLRQS